MTHLKIEQNSIPEEISARILQQLYDLAFNSELDSASDLIGRLDVQYAYRYQVDYLNQQFPNLYINVTRDWLVDFGDEEMPKALASLLGYSDNFITEVQANKIAMYAIEADGANYWYDGSNESSTSPGLLDNSKIRFINFQPLPRLKTMTLVKRIHCPLLEVINTGNIEGIGLISTGFAQLGDARSIFSSVYADNESPNIHTMICKNALLFGASCIYQCDSIVDVYAPRCKWIGKYQTRHNDNWSLFYLEDVVAIPSDFFDDKDSRYSTLNIVINKPVESSSDLPVLYKTGSVTNPYTNSNNKLNISGTGGLESATFTSATESDINTGANCWGHCNIYVPDSCINIYKQTSPYTKLASRIYPISELSQEYKNTIKSNIGVQIQ